MPVRYSYVIYTQNLSIVNNILTNNYILYKNMYWMFINYR